MTPLTTNQLQTPIKIATEQRAKVTLTPKVANCVNTQSSPYTSVLSANTSSNTSNSTFSTINSSGNTCTSATFWSYPNLSLSQMGLDAEPPLAVSEIEPIFCNIFNPEESSSKLPELLKGSSNSSNSTLECEKDITRMSPLSWLLSVSSQDTSLGLFDQSQQILSEYLSYNMEI